MPLSTPMCFGWRRGHIGGSESCVNVTIMYCFGFKNLFIGFSAEMTHAQVAMKKTLCYVYVVSSTPELQSFALI